MKSTTPPDGVKVNTPTPPPAYLSPDHVRELAASGLSVAVATANGIHTEVDATVVGKLLGRRRTGTLGDCLVFPYFAPNGDPLDYVRLKPANPPKIKGKPAKYLAPNYSANRVYLPVHTRTLPRDPNAPLVIVEGEKKAACVDANGFRVLGLSGVWNWQKPRPENEEGEKAGERELIPDLEAVDWRGRVVVIVFDSDAAGNGLVRAAEKALATVLAAKGATVKVVRLPGGPAGEKWGADDFLVANGAEAFATLVTEAKLVADADTTVEVVDLRPVVKVSKTEIHETIDQVREALAGVPGIYSRGGVLVEERAERLVPVPADAVMELLSRNIRFLVDNGDGYVRQPPPPNLCRPVFSRPIAPIREITATASYPVLLPDGRILDRPGFDPRSGVLVHLPAGLVVRVPDHPTRQEAVDAAARLADLFCDFPLVDDADGDNPPGKVRGCHSRSALVAFLLTVLARPAIPGPTPFTLISKNTAGTGGSLVTETLGKILFGRDMPASSYPSGDHGEMRKMITAWCVEGLPLVNLDNLVGEVGDAELCRAITSTAWSDRILGVNRTYSGPFSTVLIGSANNARLAADMPRRVVQVRLETELARPEQRDGYKYDLSTYPLAHRADLLADALTVLRAWVRAGRPQFPLSPFGKFEAWSAVVRPACVFAGLADPYTPTPSFANNRTRLLRTLAEGLLSMDPDGHGLTAAEIVRRLADHGYQPDESLRDAADAAAELMDRLTAVALGKILAGERNRNLDGIKILEAAHRDRSNMAKWVAKRIPTAPPRSESPASPANTSTHGSTSAGDAGDGNGVSPSPAGTKQKRNGSFQNNTHRGTALDKESAA